MKKPSPFRYPSGEYVLPGDRIIHEDRRFAVVESVVRAGTPEAERDGQPEGGISFVENVDGFASFVGESSPVDSATHEDILWEDAEFICRGEVISEKTRTGLYVLWPYEPGPFNGKTREESEQGGGEVRG